ncbi:MAG: O-acetyl-ADP-ribose deacetylase [Clostridia bacterium]|nr:O-acetyl-ADP-ribose deacetylase [Clostridia bacterium]
MPFEIIRADITQLKADAIVNAANHSLLGGGGVDGAIHKAAGPGLLDECKTLGGCKTGESKITKGYNLSAEYVIHTVGPVWEGGTKGEEKLLRACYRSTLELAVDHNFESIAFPLISSGVFGYPKDQAIQVAISVISEFLMDHDLMIYLVVYDQKAFVLSEKLFASVKAFISDNYVEEHHIANENRDYEMEVCYYSKSMRSLDDVLEELQETFSEHLIRMIDLKGKTDVETYKRANVDRKLFSKIRSDKFYRPSRTTVIAFSIALELNLDETKDLLEKAGFALSRSSKFDLIVEYFISEENYNIHEINEALFAFDQALLGV